MEQLKNNIVFVILGVVLVILGVLLRALVAPLILLATVVLSFAAALGVSNNGTGTVAGSSVLALVAR